MENAEINNIIKIVGLQYKKNYDDEESLKTLRYGKIMIMTDQVRLSQGKGSSSSVLSAVTLWFQTLWIQIKTNLV